MTVEHRLIGYDRETEMMEVDFHIPESAIPGIAELVGAPETDRSMLTVYNLTASQARSVAGMLRLTLDPARYDYAVDIVEGRAA